MRNFKLSSCRLAASEGYTPTRMTANTTLQDAAHTILETGMANILLEEGNTLCKFL